MDDDNAYPPPPGDLSSEAVELWQATMEEYRDDGLCLDGRELAMLTVACEHLTLAARLKAELAAADLMVEGSKGQMRGNPLIADLNATRRTVAAVLHMLRPVDRSAQGRRAAAVRHGRR